MIRSLLILLAIGFSQESCPVSNYYGPCLCFPENDGLISLQCTGVTDGNELLQTFATIPDSYLSSVDINDSPLLTSLPNDLFGELSVGDFRIRNTGLSEAQYGIIGSPALTSVTEYLIRRNSNIKTLHGETILGLTELTSFQATSNGITSLSSPLPFSPITELILTNNAIKQITESFFKQPASLSTVNLSFNNLTTEDLIPGCLEFSEQIQFLTLDLSWNNLVDGLPSSALQATHPCQLSLSGNGIVDLDIGTYAVLFYNIFFDYGVEGECFIALDNNPLNCDCSIAWLVDTDITALISEGTTCSDGRLLMDLLASDFSTC